MANKYLSADEIAAVTGFSKQFFYSEIYKSKVFGSGIPYKKFGPRAIRFDPNEVVAWLETRSQDYKSLKDAVEKRRTDGTLNIQLSERAKNRHPKVKEI